MTNAYLTTNEAATEAGMDRRALERRLRQRGLPRFRDPRDGRRILIARSDLVTFLTPRPITRTPPVRHGTATDVEDHDAGSVRLVPANRSCDESC